jgi:hypothetical protein
MSERTDRFLAPEQALFSRLDRALAVIPLDASANAIKERSHKKLICICQLLKVGTMPYRTFGIYR